MSYSTKNIFDTLLCPVFGLGQRPLSGTHFQFRQANAFPSAKKPLSKFHGRQPGLEQGLLHPVPQKRCQQIRRSTLGGQCTNLHIVFLQSLLFYERFSKIFYLAPFIVNNIPVRTTSDQSPALCRLPDRAQAVATAFSGFRLDARSGKCRGDNEVRFGAALSQSLLWRQKQQVDTPVGGRSCSPLRSQPPNLAGSDIRKAIASTDHQHPMRYV
ncbi:MAG: hypothetical protein V2I43_22180 [Parvularcula sp.]|jgi:hypothetical protein|nr:hypothetical protein [Parvularcula sp.]